MSNKNTVHFFDKIAKYYDKLNNVLSLGMHYRWRKKFMDFIHESWSLYPNELIVWDVGCGTGTSSKFLAENSKIPIRKLYGTDPSPEMIKHQVETPDYVKLIYCEDKDFPLKHSILSKGDYPEYTVWDSVHPVYIVATGMWSFRNMENIDDFFNSCRKLGVNRVHVLDFTNDYLNYPLWHTFGFFCKILDKIMGVKSYTHLYESVLNFSMYHVFSSATRVYRGKATIKMEKINNFTAMATIYL